jgi:hypothetical protein
VTHAPYDDSRPNGQRPLREALKVVAVTLKQGEAPFALAGSYGLWARGGPEPEHDVDFMVAEEDAPRAKDLLAEQDLKVVQPPEDWLFKVFIDDAMVDVIFRSGNEPIQRSRFDDADDLEVESVKMPVLSATVLRDGGALVQLLRRAPSRPRGPRAGGLEGRRRADEGQPLRAVLPPSPACPGHRHRAVTRSTVSR